MDDKAIVDVILTLDRKHLHKSMDTYGDHTLWQDVYKVTVDEKKLYIKLQISPDSKKAVIVQFKEDDSQEV
ncbi:MAG: mRNA interferase MqsR [Syntrophorhabdus sp. PtaB.Bin047]|nr:MAG: mRNA interferase MqsR [Syntrophorhabdus sp. PtaB.Bin047]